MLPDNDFEAERGSHVEDIDCNLVVRPTRTALDLTFFGEARYRLVVCSGVALPHHPPKESRRY